MKNQIIQKTAAGEAKSYAYADGDIATGIEIILETPSGECAVVALDVINDGEARALIYKVGSDEPDECITLN